MMTPWMRILSLSLFCLALPVSGTTQTILRMDYSSTAADRGGWPGLMGTNGGTFVRTRIPGVGPFGEDVYELAQRYAPNLRDYGGQYYWGWNGVIEPGPLPQGSRRYYRLWLRFSPGTNFRGLELDGTYTTGMINKLMIIGDGCGRPCRVIFWYRGDAGRPRFALSIDGGDNYVAAPLQTVGQWMSLQLELTSSTTTTSADGSYKLWINNNDYANPTAVKTGFQLNPWNWEYVMLGAYENDGLAADGEHTYQQTGFVASTAFDATFYRPLVPTTTPTRPLNIRRRAAR